MNQSHEIRLAGGTTFTTPPSEYRHAELDSFLAGLSISKMVMMEVASACKDELKAAGFTGVSSITKRCDMLDRQYWVTVNTSVVSDGEVVGQIALALPHKPISPSVTPKPVDFYVSNTEVVGEDKLKVVADILLTQLYQFSRLGTVEGG